MRDQLPIHLESTATMVEKGAKQMDTNGKSGPVQASHGSLQIRSTIMDAHQFPEIEHLVKRAG